MTSTLFKEEAGAQFRQKVWQFPCLIEATRCFVAECGAYVAAIRGIAVETQREHRDVGPRSNGRWDHVSGKHPVEIGELPVRGPSIASISGSVIPWLIVLVGREEMDGSQREETLTIGLRDLVPMLDP